MITRPYKRLVRAARLEFERAWPGTLSRTLVYCAAGVRTRLQALAALRTIHKLEIIPWPFEDSIIIGETPPFGYMADKYRRIMMFQRVMHDDGDYHVRVVIATEGDKESINAVAVGSEFRRMQLSPAQIRSAPADECAIIPPKGRVWFAGFAHLADRATRMMPCDLQTASYLLNAIVNLASPCGYRMRVTDRDGFGTKAQRRVTRGQQHVMYVGWDRLYTVAKDVGHPMAERRRPEKIRAHPKYQWLRDAGFPCTDPRIPRHDPHARQLLALELGVGYIWCPEVICGPSELDYEGQTLEMLTQPIEIAARANKKAG